MFDRKRYEIAPGFEALEDWIRSLADSFPLSGTTIYKDRNEVKIFSVLGFELNVKAFRIPNRINRFVYVYLRGSKAARSFGNARKIIASGATTPIPVGYLECISNGTLKQSFYISIQYPHDFTLRDVLLDRIPGKDNMLKKWVEFTLFLHKRGIYHLDYSPGNVLIKKEKQDFTFALVDLNRMKFMQVDFKAGLKNFHQVEPDEASLRLIATTYALLCNEPPDKAIVMLEKMDRDFREYHLRKDHLKELLKR